MQALLNGEVLYRSSGCNDPPATFRLVGDKLVYNGSDGRAHPSQYLDDWERHPSNPHREGTFPWAVEENRRGIAVELPGNPCSFRGLHEKHTVVFVDQALRADWKRA